MLLNAVHEFQLKAGSVCYEFLPVGWCFVCYINQLCSRRKRAGGGEMSFAVSARSFSYDETIQNTLSIAMHRCTEGGRPLQRLHQTEQFMITAPRL
ncbi:hypothetical protein KGM_204486 [Danaus plexippus plexippus]|uniref:Uncharacterized protein n=1 Tax=Danaus plexippus plexippus TaxID=278856 RepID=A0A212FKV7_DANPL|nr:hypothetical protein KGM_204486 [Danaus plexippus plexippus]